MKIKKLTDEECLQKFLEFLDERVTINTGFVRDPDTDNLTHQIMTVSCGKYEAVSQPEPLEYPLRFATPAEQGETVN